MRDAPYHLTLKRRKIALIVYLCVHLTLDAIVGAQEEQPKDGRYYESLARKAYQEKDYSSFLKNMKQAVELRPNHPRLMFDKLKEPTVLKIKL
jgi:hypothetical protein